MKNKALLSTSILLIASRALASGGEIAQSKEVVLDSKKLNSNKTDQAVVTKTSNALHVISGKKIIRNSITNNHRVVIENYGEGKQSLQSKYYGDLITRMKLAQSNAQYDSTNLTSTLGNPPDSDINHCHGACHGVTGVLDFISRAPVTHMEHAIRAAGGECVLRTGGFNDQFINITV